MGKYQIIKIVEFSEFYPHETINTIQVLKRFNRDSLIRTAALLSCRYGNIFFPNQIGTSFFSTISDSHIDQLKSDFETYARRINLTQGDKIAICSYRTIAEFWRMIFLIKNEEYKNEVKDEDFEILIFKILLSINEKIYSYKYKPNDGPDVDKLIYSYNYINNDCNNFNFNHTISNQFYYLYRLNAFTQTNKTLKAASQNLFEKWGIHSWKEYAVTLFWIAKKTEDFRVSPQNGLNIIRPSSIKKDDTGLFSISLIDKLSINATEDLQYVSNSADRNNNDDYRFFREKPFIKLENGEEYVLTSIEFLCERIYNSLYFELKQLFDTEKENIGYLDYNKEFVEKFLFRNVVYNCIKSGIYVFPKKEEIKTKEEANEPDFYYRVGNNILLFECKAIKLNGSIKDQADVNRLAEELYEKIVKKTKELNTGKKIRNSQKGHIGIGQLVTHIVNIEDNTFKWDNNIPARVRYYPILVLEEPKLIQPGLFQLTNKWYKEELIRRNIDYNEISTSPLIVISIATLYKFRNIIRKIGLHQIINQFEQIEQKNSGQTWLSFEEHLYNRYKGDIGNEITDWISK